MPESAPKTRHGAKPAASLTAGSLFGVQDPSGQGRAASLGREPEDTEAAMPPQRDPEPGSCPHPPPPAARSVPQDRRCDAGELRAGRRSPRRALPGAGSHRRCETGGSEASGRPRVLTPFRRAQPRAAGHTRGHFLPVPPAALRNLGASPGC